jgi:hypothetical protein
MIFWLKVDRSLIKGEAPGFSAYLSHHLSCKRPFKFLRHLLWALRSDRKIAILDIYIHSAMFKLTRTRKPTWKWKRNLALKLKIHGHGYRHRCRHGHGIGALLLSTYIIWLNSPYSLKDCLRQFTAKFPMALSICSASSWCKECHKNLYRHLDCSPNDVLVELERSVWGKQRLLPEVCTVSGTCHIPNIVLGVTNF